MAKTKSSNKKQSTRSQKSSTKLRKTNTKSSKSPFRKFLEVFTAILLPLGGGVLISLFTMNTMEQFNAFNQPPLAPPAWLFPVAWSILCILMGVASYLIYRLPKSKDRKIALILYLVQLGFNFLWTIIFFNLGWFWPALIWLMIMWTLILILIVKVRKLSLAAFILLIPYLAWCTFATYLNIGVIIFN